MGSVPRFVLACQVPVLSRDRSIACGPITTGQAVADRDIGGTLLRSNATVVRSLSSPRNQLAPEDVRDAFHSKISTRPHGTFNLPARHSRRTILAPYSVSLRGPDSRSSRILQASSARNGKRCVAAHSFTHPFGWVSNSVSTDSPRSAWPRNFARTTFIRSTAAFPLLKSPLSVQRPCSAASAT